MDVGPNSYKALQGGLPRVSIVWLICVAYWMQYAKGMDYDPCQVSNLNPGGVGSTGNITSEGYPLLSPPTRTWRDGNCRMLITACAACRIRITFHEFTATACHKDHVSMGSCVHGCDHLMLFEPDYAEYSSQYIFDDSTVRTFTTISNRLSVVVCHAINEDNASKRFRISFTLEAKSDIMIGGASGLNESGYFTSPNFPHGYSLHNEVYTYLLQNSDPRGLVRLGFDDWNLSPSSKLTVYFHNDTHPDIYLTRMGSGDRPFVISSGPSLFVKFETGENMYSIPYVGFKAKYTFVKDPYWPDKPYTVHDNYFYSRYGGELSFPTDRCWNGDRVDCIWVITKYRDRNHDQVVLNIRSFFVVPSLDTLEIRAGNSSEGKLIGIFDQSNLTGSQFISAQGFYLRLRATCSKIRQFQAVFTSFTNATNGGACSYYYHYRCGNNRCIAKSLVCDGVDHCGDATDEQSCTTINPTTTRKDCGTTYVCRSGKGWYCLADRCNGVHDCDDGTDEKSCFTTDDPWTEKPGVINYYRLGTYIPIGLAILLMTIIACVLISCCARRKRNMLRRRQMNQTNRGFPTISGSLPGTGRRLRSASETHLNINVDIQHYLDSPPSYEEVLSASQSNYSGINNMAFSLSDSSDQLPPPPPYSPHDENPYPTPISFPNGGLYIPNPNGGMYIGMPPNSNPYPPPQGSSPQLYSAPADNTPPYSNPQSATTAQTSPPLTGFGDLTGNSDIPQVHSTGQRGSHRNSHGSEQNRTRAGESARPPRQRQRQRSRAQGGSENRNSISNTRESQPPGENANGLPGHPRGQQSESHSIDSNTRGGNATPIQNFVHNLISRAARQNRTSQPPTSLPLDTTARPRESSNNRQAPRTSSSGNVGESQNTSSARQRSGNSRTSPAKDTPANQGSPAVIHSTTNHGTRGNKRERSKSREGSKRNHGESNKPQSEGRESQSCDNSQQQTRQGNSRDVRNFIVDNGADSNVDDGENVMNLAGADASMTFV